MTHTVTFISGDGVGPEVMTSARQIIEAAQVKINWEVCEAGAAVVKKGLSTGLPKETLDSIARNKIAFKGPLETPVGYGEKSVNVSLRKIFETYGNIRPAMELPGVKTPYSGRGIDLVIVRENIEDLYAGIEYMQSLGVAQALKIISRKGCKKIARLAFAFARSQGRKKVHCATKANILKLTEGLLKRTFEEVAVEYPEIEAQHMMVDNCAHQLVKNPEQFEVIVSTNMNGDILSDLTSALVGGLGFAPSVNIGNKIALFEAVHGSAPKYAGQNVINPTAIILSGVMMLRHLKEFTAANLIEDALYTTLAVDQKLTRDIADSSQAVSTTDFTAAVISNLGKVFTLKKQHSYQPLQLPEVSGAGARTQQRRTIGVDIFIETTQDLRLLGQTLEQLAQPTGFFLKLISNRGSKVYPDEDTTTLDMSDVMRCRFLAKDNFSQVDGALILALLQQVEQHYSWNHIEKLHEFDGQLSYTKAHGEE